MNLTCVRIFRKGDSFVVHVSEDGETRIVDFHHVEFAQAWALGEARRLKLDPPVRVEALH